MKAKPSGRLRLLAATATLYTDGARAAGPDVSYEHVTGEIKAGDTYLPVFPYLNTPLPGSPNGLNGVVK
jgi:hypothetical protein